MPAKRKQAPLYLLTGLIIGVAIGLLIGYRIFPVQFFDISPVSLHEDFQQDYLTAVGLAYNSDKDMGRAYSRISQMMSPISIDKLRAMNLLKSRPYTVKGLTDKLKDGGYPESVINIAIDYVSSYNYLNDKQYALDYIYTYKNSKNKISKFIK